MVYANKMQTDTWCMRTRCRQTGIIEWRLYFEGLVVCGAGKVDGHGPDALAEVVEALEEDVGFGARLVTQKYVGDDVERELPRVVMNVGG